MTICFVFKNGFKLKMKCDEFSVTRNGLDQLTGYNAKGIIENKPIDMNLSEVVCIYRVLSDEVIE